MAKRSKKLVVCYDPGTSLSKILYRVGKGKVKHLAMESELLLVSDPESLPTSMELGKPEHNAWIQLGDDCYVVGRLAKEYRASTSIKKLKYELLVPKILAALGVIATRERLSNKFDLRLAVLLPFGESNSQKQLEEELSVAVVGFSFQGLEYQVNLKEYACYPEAYGIFSSDVNSLGIEQIYEQNLAYLMFGYRNTSLLFFREGTLTRSASCTTKLGYYDFIDKVVAKVSGISREEVQSAIRTYTESFPNPKTFCRDTREVTKIVVDDLVKSSDPERRKVEKQSIEQAISTAEEDYWQLLLNWLDEVKPSKLDGVVCCGGTSELLKDKLSEYFNALSHSPTLAFFDTKGELVTALELDGHDKKVFLQQNLANRFADVWGLFVDFADYELEENQKVA